MYTELVSRFAGGVASASDLFPLSTGRIHTAEVHFQFRIGKRKRVASKANRNKLPLGEQLTRYIQEGRSIQDMLDRVVDVLGLQLMSMVVLELARELGLSSLNELSKHREALQQRVDQWLPDTRYQRCLESLEVPESEETRLDRPVPDLESQARRVEWLLASPDLKLLEGTLGELPRALRLRFEAMVSALRAFVARTLQHSQHHQLVGRLFEQGAINAAEVAALLHVSIPDALVFLDEGGYQRSPKVIAPDRAAIFERLSRARERGDRWWEAPELVRRSAVATQRIESIDAREH